MARKPHKDASKSFLKALNAMPLVHRFKVGDLVTHRNHGNGKVIADSGDPSSTIVEFDEMPEGWDKILEVSIDCLKKR
jgi:hypothetical protein